MGTAIRSKRADVMKTAEREARKNPNVDLDAIHETLKMADALYGLDLQPSGYEIASPYGHSGLRFDDHALWSTEGPL